ncbi:MAG TPA: response regulator transcription factor [Kouleothrix sp.]|nr:response regulator transcription factor [Kouleothrix sp.]
MRVLLVEDEAVLANSIARGLRREGMAVDIAGDGEEALEKAALNHYDTVLLDRDLPLLHGDEVCRVLHSQHAHLRILMLTASGTVEQRVQGLNLGADDYLPKPFAFAELVARLHALARRAGPALPSTLVWADITIDPSRRSVARVGQPIVLSSKELAVLEQLIRADGAVLSAETLLEQVWDENADPFTNTVRTTVYTLRRKLGDPPLIETVIGAGYRMVNIKTPSIYACDETF